MPQDSQLVDMMGLARETVIKDSVGSFPGSIKVIAPAKVNLFLGVGPEREDGFHSVVTAMHALVLHDVLYMRLSDSGTLSRFLVPNAELAAAKASSRKVDPDLPSLEEGESCSENENALEIRLMCIGCEGVEPPVIPASENIAYKAVSEVARRYGMGAGQTMEIRIEKHVPSQAGLGGGSSDAAAAILGAARLWGIASDDPMLEEIACDLGSDIAFFFKGGCAVFQGRGEEFVRTLEPRKDSVVLVQPSAGLSTAEVYRAFSETSDQELPDELLKAVETATSAREIGLFNSLASSAERIESEVAFVMGWLRQQQGVSEALLSGSGSATFALCDSFSAACSIASAAKQRGWWARATMLGKLKAGVVS